MDAQPRNTHIESPQHRPPYDMDCPMLQIATGCSHGKCHFCDIFTGVLFSPAPPEEVAADIEEIARTATALTRRIYLTGGNPFALPTPRLVEVFDAVEARIPTVNSYGGFCRIMDVARKSDSELAQLAARGVDRITIGAESGFDEALSFMEKGHTAADVVEQGQRLRKAGIRFTFFYLAGMAGAGRGQENAKASARVFSEAGPDYILVVTLTPTKTWPLARDIAAGTWQPAGEVETAREIRTFIEHLTCPCTVNCSHDTDILRFEGTVPYNQDKMLELMDNLIPKMSEKASRRMREMIHKATF
ncbi:MAG: radical SAM protein [Eggerthellaceae bacterium]|nr:radical SAM protein [Eggerthellaceae bacterium]